MQPPTPSSQQTFLPPSPQQPHPQQTDTPTPIIQKVIIYGVTNPQGLSITRIRNNEVKVGIRKCYSYVEKEAGVRDTTEIEEDKYEMWVYPDGIKITDSTYTIINDPSPQFSFTEPNIIHPQKLTNSLQSTSQIPQPLDNIYSFILTDYDLNRTYCTCLVWHEKRFVENDEDQEWMEVKELERTVVMKEEVRDDRTKGNVVANLNSKILPKCTLSELVKDPLVLDPTSSLVYIPKGLILCSPFPCLTFQRDLITFLYMNAIKKHGQTTLHKHQMDELKTLIAKFGYPQAQKFYDQEEFLSQREDRAKMEEKEMPIKPYQLHSKKTYERLERQKREEQLGLKSLRMLGKKKLEEFYLSVVFLPELVQCQDRLETPTQVVRVEDTLTTLPPTLPFHPYYFSSTCFRMPNINILSTIERIGISNLITLWKNAILQRQILVFSSDQFLTIQLFETLLYLMEPLKWENIYVPFLPFHLCHHIQALGGYLIGMSIIHMDYMIEHFNLQSKVFVDLDQMIIIEQGGNANTEIPKHIRQWMVKELQQLGFKDKETRSKQGHTSWGFPFSSLLTQQQQLQRSEFPSSQVSQQQQITITFSLHRVFYISLYYLLNNYSPYILQDGTTIRFDRQPYFRLFSTQEDKKFASQIVKTMMFIRLCEFHKTAEKSLKWNQSDICSLFVYCHYVMKQEGKEQEYWQIAEFDEESIATQSLRGSLSTKYEKEGKSAQKLREYIDYVIRKNVKELTGPSLDCRTYKVEHYLVKYLNYMNYQSPGIIKMEESLSTSQEFQWFDWLLQILRRENIEKQQEKRKKEKLNRLHDFWAEGKSVVNLKELFKDIGRDLYGGLKKQLAVDGGWTNSKVLEKMKLNKERQKSSHSVK